jgi:hypothetical protein
MRSVSIKSFRKNKTYISCSVPFPENRAVYEIKSKKFDGTTEATDTMAHARLMLGK